MISACGRVCWFNETATYEIYTYGHTRSLHDALPILMFSCAFDVFITPQQLATLSPLAGLAACEALRELVQAQHRKHLSMKWPNDVQWHYAKLAGILEIGRASCRERVCQYV